MEMLSAQLIQLIGQALNEKSVSFFLSQEWGSQNSDHREKIHQALESQKTRTEPASFTYSISHTIGLGGFVTSTSKNKQIGFDVEIKARVSNQIAKRISFNSTEFQEAPSAAQLWVAKESAYKALRGQGQPKVITELNLGQWLLVSAASNNSEQDFQVETFRLLSQSEQQVSDSIGITFTRNEFIFGIFLLGF